MRKTWIMSGVGVLLLTSGQILQKITIGLGFLGDFISLFGGFLIFYGMLCQPYKNQQWCHWASVIRRVVNVCLVVMALSFVAIEGLIAGQSRGDSFDGDYLIVLGAGLYGEVPSLSLISRLDAAKAYLQDHPESKAVLSGGRGQGETITEAKAMQRYLLSYGVAESRLYLEENAHNTRENLIFSQKLLIEQGVDLSRQPVGIVTNDFHLYRAKTLAGTLGLQASGLSAPTPSVPGLALSVYLREYFAVGKMYLQMLI